MILPTKSTTSDILCPARLLPRDFVSGTVSTAKSFKSWDTCMDNKTCKIIAIVGIVLAVLVVIGLFSFIIRCACYGARGICELFCCCCMCCNNAARNNNARGIDPNNHGREMNDIPRNSAYNNPHMYPQQAYHNQYNQQSYDNQNWNRGYAPVYDQQMKYTPGVISDEVPDEKYDYHSNKAYRGGYN